MINFKSKLTADKDYTRYIDNSKDTQFIKKIVESKEFDKLSKGADITLHGRKNGKVVIDYGNDKIEIYGSKNNQCIQILRHMLLYTCGINGKNPRSSLNSILEEYAKLAQEIQDIS